MFCRRDIRWHERERERDVFILVTHVTWLHTFNILFGCVTRFPLRHAGSEEPKAAETPKEEPEQKEAKPEEPKDAKPEAKEEAKPEAPKEDAKEAPGES